MDWHVLFSSLPEALVAVLGAGGESEVETANHQIGTFGASAVVGFCLPDVEGSQLQGGIR